MENLTDELIALQMELIRWRVGIEALAGAAGLIAEKIDEILAFLEGQEGGN